MKWILQDRSFALGNFVNITPIIKHLFLETAKPVPVHFETQYVRDAYEGCHMIEIMEQLPEGEPYASSSMICRLNVIEDYKHAFQLVTGHDWNPMFKPFVHVVKRAVIICGSGSERTDYLNSKDPGVEPYGHAIRELHARGYHTVFVGSWNDAVRHDGRIMDKCRQAITDDMPAAIEAIRTADLIIANDTGLAHVAGTFNKLMLLLWKHTPRIRVRNSGTKSTYSDMSMWQQDIDAFITAYAK